MIESRLNWFCFRKIDSLGTCGVSEADVFDTGGSDTGTSGFKTEASAGGLAFWIGAFLGLVGLVARLAAEGRGLSGLLDLRR
jgi:hypothetical protein